MVTLKKYLCLFVLTLALLMPGVSGAGIVDVNSVRVSDVTPVQFAVIWGTSEPATGSVNLFADADGTTPVTNAVVTFDSSNHPPAEDIGVLKVSVSNLKPSTQYFFQIKTYSKVGGGVFSYPEGPPFLDVRTEQSTVIVHNDVLAQQISIGDGKSTQGTLVIAEIDQASYPVTGWAGAGVPEGWVAIDANNFYDKDTHVNLELVGGEPITLTFFCGSMGSMETQDNVPAESGKIQAVKVAANLPSSGGDSPTSSGGSSGGGGGGGACFISTVSSQ